MMRRVTGFCLDVRFLFLGGAGLGIGLGLVVGWLLWPVTYFDTDLYDLRQDYQDEVVVMVGAQLALEGDVEAARAALSLLSQPDAPRLPEQIVVEVMERYVAQAAASADVELLVALADALGTPTTAMQPLLEGR
jgi:hypothetical protein